MAETISTAADVAPALDQRLLHAVSNIAHVLKHKAVMDGDKNASANGQWKHLRLLDGIALLLVKSPKSDVTATSFSLKPDAVDFYYAKNGAIELETKTYLSSMLKVLASLRREDKDTTVYMLLGMALSHCEAKFNNRLKKVRATMTSNGLDRATLRAALNGGKSLWELPWESGSELAEQLRGAGYPGPAQATDGQCVAAQLVFLGFSGRTDGSFRLNATIIAFIVGNFLRRFFREFNEIAQTLVTRIVKLGDYYGAARSIVDTFARDDIYPLRTAVKPIPVNPSPTPHTVDMATDYVAYLNEFADNNDCVNVSFNEIDKQYPGAMPIDQIAPGNTHKVTVSVHCECTLAVHLLAQRRQANGAAAAAGVSAAAAPAVADSVEIGVSKQTCLWCQEYLAKLAALSGVDVRVRRFHGKGPAGWQLPDAGPAAAARLMVTRLEDEALEILSSINRKRRSDSTPTNLRPAAPGSDGTRPLHPHERLDPFGAAESLLAGA